MKQRENTELSHWNGTTQNDRLFKALLPESIKIDERSTSDLLAFASRYAEIINYYNGKNELDGNWQRFFKKDLSVFLATIIATNLKKIERRHNFLVAELNNSPRDEDRLNALEGLFEQTIDFAILLDSWYVHCLEMTRLDPTNSTELENELENAIKQQLAPSLAVIIGYQKDLDIHKIGPYSEDVIREKLHYIWFKKYFIEGETSIDVDDIDPSNLIASYSKKIRILYRSFYSVTTYIIQISPKFLEKSLTEKDDHHPDIGLFITFLELFKHTQDHINGLTKKHLDFYYYDVLKQSERGFTPDQVNVYFELSPHMESYTIEKGTLLGAGNDFDGREIHYAVDRDLVVNKAYIKSLKSLYVSKNPKINIGSSYRLITNMYSAPVANSKDGKGMPFVGASENWPLFGEELLDKTEADRQMGYGEIGWAISAPILEMEEGHRVVTMRFEFERASMYTLNLLIKDLKKNLDVSRLDAFSKVFKDSLDIYFTTTDGWVQAYTCEVLPPEDWGQPEITIVATLTASDPPIIKYIPQLMGEGYDTNFPIVKIMHRNLDSVYSYSFFKELILETVTIDVTAKGCKNLDLYSDLGVVNSNMPFQLFGPLPKKGSYLMVGKAELFKKDLTDLSFNFHWHNLPNDEKGLRGYFKNYNLGIKNDSFKIRFSALTNNMFFPAEGDVQVDKDLYVPNPAQPANIDERRTFDSFDLKAFNILPDYDFEMPDTYSNSVKTGFFKIELMGPNEAYGHDYYSDVYTKAVSHNMNPKKKGPDIPLPNVPYVPMVKTLSLDYSASTQINIISIGTISKGESAVEQVYHIHPYGIIRTFHEGKTSNRALVPSYDDDAYLYIGLKDLHPPTSLSLYFETVSSNEDTGLLMGQAEEEETEVVWSYMVNDQWVDFSPNQILFDATNGFNASGIIELEITKDITKDNHILPADLHWIRVTAKGNPAKLGRAVHVSTQAVSATWVNNGNSGEHLSKPLRARKINRLDVPVPGIREVFQPFPSFGGRPGEQKIEFYTRVSERLRHKNRAVAAWDFERIILDRFPMIYQVKCITHLGNEKFVPHGTVRLIVVPNVDPNGQNYLPHVNNTVLESIKEYLTPRMSPFVNLEVRNPIYERLKISCGVRFQKGKNNGTYLKRLNLEIKAFMCPWLFGKKQELELGGSVSKDAILSFIEKRPYVEFVTKFSVVKVFSTEQGFDISDTAIDLSSSPLVKASTPWSVVIPMDMNPIYFLDETTFQAPDKSSINSMIVQGDFVMTEEKEPITDEDFLKDNDRKQK